MELELLKLAGGNGGSVVVFMVCLVLFLRHINAKEATYQATIKEVTDAHAGHVTALTDKVFDIANKTTAALYELKTAVVELQGRLKQ